MPMKPVDTQPSPTAAPLPEGIHTAFREVHGRRLHGFALLLTLGDRPEAARLAGRTLTAAARKVGELRHPERAAAWLRAHLLRNVRRVTRTDRPGPAGIRALADLGADASAVTALGILSTRERAALIAHDIERLDQRDVATILGTDGGGVERVIKRARSRYMDSFAAISAEEPADDGPLIAQIKTAAERALR